MLDNKEVLSGDSDLRVIPRIFEEEMETSYGDYAMSVIVSRALPDARDGLKPVHRRLLYSMNELGLDPSKGYKKSARIVGDTMGKYHPHGDCLHGDTQVFLADGRFKTMQELYEEGGSYDVLCLDANGNVKIASAHSFRVGQHTNELYHIHLSDGSVVTTTSNHPFMLKDLSWNKAEELKANTVLNTKLLYFDTRGSYRPTIGGLDIKRCLLQSLIDGEGVRHHKDENINNNSISNIEIMTRGEHAKHHKDYLLGLAKGRNTMFNEDNREITREKNSKLLTAYNKYKPLYTAYKVLAYLDSINKPLTEDNYSQYKNESNVYNPTRVETLVRKSFIRDFDDLVLKYTEGYSPVSEMGISCEYEEVLEVVGDSTTKDVTAMQKQGVANRVYQVFQCIIEQGLELTKENYEKVRKDLISKTGLGYGNIHNRNYPTLRTVSKNFDTLVEIFKVDYPYVVDVVVEKVASEPMYDFTVDGYENMLIPVRGDGEGKYTMVCVHNSSIYDAMVRLAQPFSMRYPLVDGHGNFGSIDGDGAAAQRYTEAKLLKLSTKMLEDIDKNTVDFKPNYDEELTEPTVLPAKLPNLLVNGASGIAVGMATNMPPHNLNEVVDAICVVIDNKTSNLDTDIEELIPVLSAPDFPTGGVIVGTSGIKEAYRTGKGRVVLRAKAVIETDRRNRQSIVVSEIPYQVNKSKLVEKIAELVKDKKVEGISDLRDESDRSGIRIVVEIKRDADANIVLNQLYKNTQMQVSFGINNLALVNGEPKQLNLLELINIYLDHQKEVVTRRTQFELEKAEKRAHILEGLFIALDHIDEVIKIIRASSDGKEARANLSTRFGLTDEQATAIVEMRLRALTGLERDKLQKEYDDLMETIAYLRSILADEKVLFGVIRTELVGLVESFGDKRRTQITENIEDFDVEDLIADEQCVITMTSIGYIKRLPASTYKSQKRGGRGVVGMQTREADEVSDVAVCMTLDNILFFTSKGRVYSKKGYEIPEAGRNAKGTAIVNLLSLDPDEKIKAIIPIRDLSADNTDSFAMITKNGTIKKTSVSEYTNIRNQGIIAINIVDGDELVQVEVVNEDDTIFVATNTGLGSRFKSSDVRNMGRTATGVRAMKTSKDNYVIGFAVCEDEDNIIFVSDKGYGKSTPASEFAVKNRGLKGMLCYNVSNTTGELSSILTYNEYDELLLVNSLGTVIRIKAKDIPVLGRNTRGSKLITIDDGDYITSISKVVDED